MKDVGPGANPVEGMTVIKGLEYPSYEDRVGDVQSGEGSRSGDTLQWPFST